MAPLLYPFLQKDIGMFCRMDNCYYFCNRVGMNREMPTLCNKFNFKKCNYGSNFIGKWNIYWC